MTALDNLRTFLNNYISDAPKLKTRRSDTHLEIAKRLKAIADNTTDLALLRVTLEILITDYRTQRLLGIPGFFRACYDNHSTLLTQITNHIDALNSDMRADTTAYSSEILAAIEEAANTEAFKTALKTAHPVSIQAKEGNADENGYDIRFKDEDNKHFGTYNTNTQLLAKAPGYTPPPSAASMV